MGLRVFDQIPQRLWDRMIDQYQLGKPLFHMAVPGDDSKFYVVCDKLKFKCSIGRVNVTTVKDMFDSQKLQAIPSLDAKVSMPTFLASTGAGALGIKVAGLKAGAMAAIAAGLTSEVVELLSKSSAFSRREMESNVFRGQNVFGKWVDDTDLVWTRDRCTRADFRKALNCCLRKGMALTTTRNLEYLSKELGFFENTFLYACRYLHLYVFVNKEILEKDLDYYAAASIVENIGGAKLITMGGEPYSTNSKRRMFEQSTSYEVPTSTFFFQEMGQTVDDVEDYFDGLDFQEMDTIRGIYG